MKYTRLQAAYDYQRAATGLDPGNYPKGYDFRSMAGYYRILLSQAMARLSSEEA